MWQATRKDQQTKLEMYRILKSTAATLKAPEILFFIENISQIEPDNLMEQELDVVYEISRFGYRASEYTMKGIHFLYSVAVREKDYPKKLVETGVEKFLEIIKSQDRDIKNPFIAQCAQNIKEQKCTIQSVKILIKLIDYLPSYKIGNQPSLIEVTTDFIEKEGLIDAIVADLTAYQA